MKLNFQFGNKRPNNNQLIILFIVLSTIILGLSKCSGVSENGLWDLLDEIQRKFFPQGPVNELIIKDEEKLKRRIERDVTKAIEKVTPEYNRIIRESDRKFEPKYIDGVNDESVCYTDGCKALAPPMRICSPVVEGINCK
jgi:hypothetical protein